MSLLASHRTLAAASSLLLAAIGLTGCLSLPGGAGGSKSSDIASMKNIPEGIKRDLINQMNSASGAEKSKIVDKANALNNMVGRDLVGVEPAIMGLQKYKLDTNGTVTVNKDDSVYGLMSAADYWRLGGPSISKEAVPTSSTCGPSRSTTPTSPTSPWSAASRPASKHPAHTSATNTPSTQGENCGRSGV